MMAKTDDALWLAAFLLMCLAAIVFSFEYSAPFAGATFWFFGTVALLALR
jgi:hypothetical protein